MHAAENIQFLNTLCSLPAVVAVFCPSAGRNDDVVASIVWNLLSLLEMAQLVPTVITAAMAVNEKEWWNL